RTDSFDLRARPCAGRAPAHAVVELVTTAALALSTGVAITAVSFGIARADTAATADVAGVLPLALLIGGMLGVVGLLAALLAEPRRPLSPGGPAGWLGPKPRA